MSKPHEVFETDAFLDKPQGARTRNRIPFRVWIALMVLLTTYVNYTTRVNLAVSVVSMVRGAKDKPVHVPECIELREKEERERLGPNVTLAIHNTTARAGLPDYGPRYEWSERLQGTLLGSYFYGYVITSLFGGAVSEWFGPKIVIFLTHLIIAVVNSAGVYAVQVHWGLLVACRVVIGACAGLVYPALQVLIAKWAPPSEKGKFIGCLMGNTLGTAVTWPLVGWVTMQAGWDWGFHIVSIQNIVFCVIFFIIASDAPTSSKFISAQERDYISESQGASVSSKRGRPPIKAIFLSIPFWMLTVLHFGNLWGLYVQLQSVPKFMAQVVGFNLKEAGGLAALPHIVRLFTGIAYGTLEDLLKSKKIMSTKAIRKTFVVSSHILPGICLILIALTRCSEVGAIVLLVLSMGLNGAATITNLRNPQDLAPNFAGTIFGIISFIGGLTGFITPAVLGEFTQHDKGVNQWVYYFCLSGGVYIFCGVIFILFGSVNLQPWNEIKDKDSE